MVYKLKTRSDGPLDKYKERLVIKVYSQPNGEDYYHTYSPVAKDENKFEVFLYGRLNKDVYMEDLNGYEECATQSLWFETGTKVLE